MVTTNLQNWDFKNYHVQEDLASNEFISAETTLLAAGPPSITHIHEAGVDTGLGAELADGDIAFPIGVTENVSLSQSKQLQRIFEIGSSRSYFIPGRVVGSLNVGRILYSGPTLLRSLYAYYHDPDAPTEIVQKISTPGLSTMPNVIQSPGAGDFWMNLASDLFNQPTGLLLYYKNALGEAVAQTYFEMAYIQGHQLTISSGSVLIMEGVSLQFDRMVPVVI